MLMIKYAEKYTPREDLEYMDGDAESKGERKAALEICEKIRENLGLEWSDVQDEVKMFEYSPGEHLPADVLPIC